MPSDLDAATELLEDARRLVVLTGAGISTESGIPDFRSPGGLWTRYDPTKLTFDKFCASAETRRTYWEMGNELFPALRDAQPNTAHRVLAALERRGGRHRQPRADAVRRLRGVDAARQRRRDARRGRRRARPFAHRRLTVRHSDSACRIRVRGVASRRRRPCRIEQVPQPVAENSC